MKRSNLITGIVFLALSIFAYVQAAGMVGRIEADRLGPAFWPKCLSAALGVLSVILIFQGLFGGRKEHTPPPIDIKSEGFLRVVKVSGVLILFAAITYTLGIYAGILVMLPLCMLLHGERNVKILAGLTVGMCLFISLVFGAALRVPLPTGIIFG